MAIMEEILSFYKNLMGTSVQTPPTINRLIMRKGPKLNHPQQLAMCEAVTTTEIYEGLCSIGDDKAPRVDGYNAVFFKKTWHIIKEEVTKAVLVFFTTGKLYRAINCTSFTLIPKTENPFTMKVSRFKTHYRS
ncbi:uncharacterized protein [Nicotiana tomentosiformis]|uniref:uncharacterized protein n=1 Tax=Nicotiana tomentosiformis TaxID=4098 RepID=UPI00388C9161